MYFVLRKLPGSIDGVAPTVPVRTFFIKNFTNVQILQDCNVVHIAVPQKKSTEQPVIKSGGNKLSINISWIIQKETTTRSSDTAGLTDIMEQVDYLIDTMENREIDQTGKYHLFLGNDGGTSTKYPSGNPAHPDAFGTSAEGTNPSTAAQAQLWFDDYNASSNTVGSIDTLKFEGYIDHLEISASSQAPIIWTATLYFIAGVRPADLSL